MDNKVIIIADDESPFRTTQANTLTYFDYNVRAASCGQEFKDMVSAYIDKKRKSPFALIVDNQMPNKPGEEEKQWCGLECMIELCENFPDIKYPFTGH